ncbi:oligosaccharide flippase family protein [Bradyrhizobium japonicum]|uniref:oligosaccharide flippase family protein n=1 Tax=Bradyrhizobium japonicum TaxID=375 RepID=UPI0004A2ECF5|nr:oligosaccharide flippase family protein [Bradyrhizobium japonicum]
MNRHAQIGLSRNPSLRRRVIGAGIWSIGGFGVNLVIRFGGNLLLTRLLAPEMFGIMAVATVVMATLTVLSDLGLKQSVIQNHRGADPTFLNTVWTIQIVRGAQLALLALGVAALMAVAQHYGAISSTSVYADSRVPSVIAVVSVTAIVSGFASTKTIEAARNLQIRRATLVEIAAQVIGLGVMLGWIAHDRSIWALVAGSIASASMSTVLSHAVLFGHRNRLAWDKSTVREVVKFGKWMLLGSIIGAMISNLDRVLLAGMTDAAALGVYAIAFNLYLSAEHVLMRAVSSIGYPAISEVVRSRPENLQAAYYRMHRIVALAAYAGFGLLVVASPRLIGLLYDQRYSNAGWMLQILSIGLLFVPAQLALQTFLAMNRPKLNTALASLRLATMLCAMPIGFKLFGLPGALVGLAGSSVVCIPVIAFFSIRLGFFNWRRELFPLPAIALGLVAGEFLLMLPK